MLKRIAALALSAALLTGSAAAVTPEEAFPAVHTYPGFIDVAEGAWYAGAARVCCEVGLMQGTGQAFAPDQVLTVGEVAAIAARMNQAVTGDAVPEAGPGQPWYAPYVACLEGLGVAVPDPEKAASRQEFVSLLAAVVPEDMLTPINTITSLPDTEDADVLAFYNAGILTGVDDWGTFAGDKTLTRAECAAMAARITRPELRLTNTQEALPAALAELGLPVRPLLAEDQVLAITQDPTLIYTTDGRVLDWTGALVYDLSAYDQYDPFLADGVARVQKDGLYGYVNQYTGTEIVPCQYETATTYHYGVVLAGSQEEGFTAFNNFGEVLGTLDGSVNYDDTSEQLIQYVDESTGLYGYLNPDGSVAVEAAYPSVYPFSGGYAAVRDESGLAGFINTEGELVIPCQFALVTSGFNYEGYAVVGTAGTTPNPLHYDGKLGLINTAGELVVPMEYDYLQNVSDGLALFARIEEDGTVVKGYLSPDGTEHVPELLASLPENQLPAPFVNGRAPFLDGDLQGLMNTQFEVVLPAAFERCISGSSGGQAVVLLDGMWYQVKL